MSERKITPAQLEQVCRVLGYDPQVVALIEASPDEVDVRVWDAELELEVTHHYRVTK
jgi:hypothetical protein